MRLENKVAVITGAGTGIGRACALAFAREGARLALVGRREQHLQTLARELGGSPLVVPADVSKPEDVRRIVDKVLECFGALHVLLNNAGVLTPGTAETNTEDDFQRTFDINVKGVWLLSRAVLPAMRKAGGGSIVNVGSVLGLVGAKNRALYAASKGAVTLLTKCMALDPADDQIRVNCICPSFIETELTAEAMNKMPDPAAARAERISVHPLGRLGVAEDVTGIAIYLASDESSWTTGATFAVDGGLSAR